MKLCDGNAHIGHWPFRPLPWTDAETLLREMDRLDIERAAVAHSHGLLYRNPQRANEELAAAVREHRDRLVPVATLDPLYVDALGDLKRCREELGMKALRLAPPYHGCTLASPETLALGGAARELAMTVLVPFRVEDLRQRHRFDADRNTPAEDLFAFAMALPGLAVLGTQFSLKADEKTVEALKAAPGLHFEITRIRNSVPPHLSDLVRAVGAERFLFGTGMPFLVPEVAQVRLALLEDGAARTALAAGNFRRLFG
jgi:predicted TIM-barrel fold metal-dependent hydrolase